jgi:hypothetical protein
MSFAPPYDHEHYESLGHEILSTTPLLTTLFLLVFTCVLLLAAVLLLSVALQPTTDDQDEESGVLPRYDNAANAPVGIWQHPTKSQ